MNEYYSAGEYKRFDEHRVFKAELYNKAKEIAPTGKEESRQGHEYKPDTRSRKKERGSSNPFKRLIEKMTTSASSVATTVVSTVVAAVAAVTVCVNVFAPRPDFEVTSLEAGNDYVEYCVQLGKLDENIEYSLVVENSYHSFEQEVEKGGEHQGLVTGLKPGLAYDLTLVGRTENGESEYYQERFYTTNTDTPGAVFDIFLSQGEKKDTADITYSVYVSDAYGVVQDYYLEIENEGVAYHTDKKITEGFFKGMALNVPWGESTVRIKGTINGTETVIGEYTVVNSITPKPSPPVIDPPVEEPPVEEQYVELLAELTPAGVNAYYIDYYYKRMLHGGVATMYIHYISPMDEKVEERELYYELTEFWEQEYLEIPGGCTEVKVRIAITEKNETGDPVVVFETGKSYEIPEEASITPLVDISSGWTYLDIYGSLPQDAIVEIIDTSGGEMRQYPVYDGYYISRVEWENGVGAVEYTYRIVNSTGDTLNSGGTFTADYGVVAGKYDLNYRNPNDAVVTYNDDGTMNVYLYVDFASDDAELYCEITLDKAYRLTGSLLVAEDIRAGEYGIAYRVCKDIGGVKHVVGGTVPSGTVGRNIYTDISATVSGKDVTVKIAPETQCLLDKGYFVSASGEKIMLDSIDVVTDPESGVRTAELHFEGEADKVKAYLYFKPQTPSADYEKILALTELKGSEYCLCVLDLN